MTGATPITDLEFRLRSLPGMRAGEAGDVRQTLYSSGDPARLVWLCTQGLVKTERISTDGRSLLVSIVRPGELFGLDATLGGETYQESAELLTAGTWCSVPAAEFLTAAAEQPELWRAVAQALAVRQREMEDRMAALLALGVEQRILNCLQQLAHYCASDDGNAEIPLSQAEVANLVGATRETTSTALNILARKGVLELRRRRIRLATAGGIGALALAV
jgi:CRP/FNR family transcriptional regulator